MNELLNSLKTSLLNGIYLALPFLFIIFILKVTLEFLIDITTPIVLLLPDQSVFGFGMSYVFSISLFLLLILTAGMLQGKERKLNFISKAENILPGFSVIKKMISANDGSNSGKRMQPCLVFIDETYQFAFLIEESREGLSTVFIPSSPVPTSGNVHIVADSKVQRINSHPKEVIKCLTQVGEGTRNILDSNSNLVFEMQDKS
ncbi:MAG: hypothetical protein HGGPFJEG_00445 [Ignavibacteria bacterium]|nr:hypothetical protein [Ignavibacteria bacterium]